MQDSLAPMSPEVGAGTTFHLGFDLLLEEAETDLHSQGGGGSRSSCDVAEMHAS